MTHYSIAIAGSTHHTLMCAEALAKDQRFSIPWILTPSPKPIGRKQVLTKNPLQIFAEEHHVPLISVEKRIDDTVQTLINTHTQPDFLLVVDFGYLIPKWLLDLPKKAPLNIHPSLLPKWRGSSPGQFVLLYGEKESAVTFMIMDEGLDSGPIIHQLQFSVDSSWTQKDYYAYSFTEIVKVLGDLIEQLATDQLSPTPQPADSPTPIARRLTKDDGFVSWNIIQTAMKKATFSPKASGTDSALASPTLLSEVASALKSWPQAIENATRALSPWPVVWTLLPTAQGEKRMQILTATLNSEHKLVLGKVKIEGQKEADWSEVKNQIT